MKNNNKNESHVFQDLKKFNQEAFVEDINLAYENYITLLGNHSLDYVCSNSINKLQQFVNKLFLI